MSIEDLAGSLRKATGGVPPASSGSGASGGGDMPPWLVKFILLAVGIFILSAFLPIELIVLIAIGYGALFIYARFFYPNRFLARIESEVAEERQQKRTAIYREVGLYPTRDSNSLGSRGYVCPELGLYVLIAPRSTLLQGEEEIPASTHRAAAESTSEYDTSWRLLSHEEATTICDKLIEVADSLNYTITRTGATILSKIGGKKAIFEKMEIFEPVIEGVTASEQRHGEDRDFSYDIQYEIDDSGLVSEVTKNIGITGGHRMLTVCADMRQVMDSKAFQRSVTVEELSGGLSEINKYNTA